MQKNIFQPENNPYLAVDFKELLAKHSAQLPKVGDTVTGSVISASKNEVQVDIGGVAVGVARGFELIDESGEYSNLKIGDEVTATVLELENENGALELSFRAAGHRKAWDALKDLMSASSIVEVKIMEANKGGLMVQLGNISGFLPVSQLCPEHYPRIQGGDKSKILERLKSYVGQTFEVKVLDALDKENKLIVSEKAAWEEKQQDILSQYKEAENEKGGGRPIKGRPPGDAAVLDRHHPLVWLGGRAKAERPWLHT